MMTSKEKNYTLVSLSLETSVCYDSNLAQLSTLIKQTPKNSCIVAPEVCLTGFDYENFANTYAFAPQAITVLKELSSQKIIILTLIEKINGEVFNMLKVIHKGEVKHSRAKARLFRFGGEHKYFVEGKDENFQTLEVDGMKIAILICFELRFKELWKVVEGADIIAVPSWWGKMRTEHFKALTQTLAIMNQCYVIACDSKSELCSGISRIITPQGKVHENGNSPCLEYSYKQKEIALMRRYMDVGIG